MLVSKVFQNQPVNEYTEFFMLKVITASVSNRERHKKGTKYVYCVWLYSKFWEQGGEKLGKKSSNSSAMKRCKTEPSGVLFSLGERGSRVF